MRAAALVLAAVLAIPVGIEVVARLGEDVILYPYQYDPELGWVNSPRQTVEDRAPQQASRSPGWKVETDADGCRVQFGAQDDPPSEETVLVIGDSFTIAHQVPYAATFASRIEQSMRSKHLPVRVRACGVADYGTYQELLHAERLLRAEPRPGALVLQVFAYNDLLNDSILAAGAGAQDLYRPYRRTARRHDALVRHVRSWSRAYRMLESITFRSLFPIVGWPDPRSAEATNDVLDGLRRQLPTWTPSEPVWQVLFGAYLDPEDQPAYAMEGWISITEDLRDFKDLAQRYEIPLIVVLIPHEHELRAREPDQQERLGYRADRRAAEDRLSKLLADLGIRHVRLIDRFDQHQDLVTPYVEGHLNAEAHRLVAEAIDAPLTEALRTR